MIPAGMGLPSGLINFARKNEAIQYTPKMVVFFCVFFISLTADGPHYYHPACGHKESSHLSLVHALQFFIAMQVQHSYNSSSNG